MKLQTNSTRWTRTSILMLSLAIAFVMQGCSHRSTYHVTDTGKHKVMIVGHDSGFTTRDGLEEREDVAIARRQSLFGRNTEVVIKDGELSVNGRSYGALKERDSVTVDRDRVFINESEVQELARR